MLHVYNLTYSNISRVLGQSMRHVVLACVLFHAVGAKHVSVLLWLHSAELTPQILFFRYLLPPGMEHWTIWARQHAILLNGLALELFGTQLFASGNFSVLGVRSLRC